MPSSSNIFRDAFIARIKSAATKAHGLRDGSHPGTVGVLREIVAGELIEGILPPEVKIGSGQLVSHTGCQSRQLDIILYSPGILVPNVYDGKNGYFPVESCLYSIEIKSRLSRKRLMETIESARIIHSLQNLPTRHWQIPQTPTLPTFIQYGTPRPIVGILAFASDLKHGPQAEMVRYRELDDRADEDPALGFISIFGRGYWHFDHNWKFTPATPDLEEIALLLAGIAHTLPGFLVAKGRPQIGRYLHDTASRHSPA